MPKKPRYSAKEHRQIEHIARSEKARGRSEDEAKAIGYGTVTKRNPKKNRYNAKERRQAEHTMESEEKRGQPKTVGKRIAYTTRKRRGQGVPKSNTSVGFVPEHSC